MGPEIRISGTTGASSSPKIEAKICVNLCVYKIQEDSSSVMGSIKEAE
jgi:hypothetical protein